MNLFKNKNLKSKKSQNLSAMYILIGVGLLITLVSISSFFISESSAEKLSGFVSSSASFIGNSVSNLAQGLYARVTGFVGEEGSSESSDSGASSDSSSSDSSSDSSSESASSEGSSESSSDSSSETSTETPTSESPTEEISETPIEEITSTETSQETIVEPPLPPMPEPTPSLPSEPSSSPSPESPAVTETPAEESNITEGVIAEDSVSGSGEIVLNQSEELNISSLENITSEVNFSEVVVAEIITNETLIISNLTEIANETLIISNLTEIANETLIISNQTSVNITLQTTTKQYGAILGKPVKWEKKIKISSESMNESVTETINVELPSSAGDVIVKKVDSETGEETDITENSEKVSITNDKKIEEKAAIITGNVVLDSKGEGILTRFFNSIGRFFNSFLALTGKAIDEIVDLADSESAAENASIEESVSVSIEEQISNNDEIIVEYYTEAPYAEENITSNSSKKIIIVGPENVHYQDILASSELPSEVASENKIMLLWINETSGEKQVADFSGVDSDENGLIDSIEWVVPHLSNQSYEIIIITNAVHLDSNRTFISNIYDSVSIRDGNFSEVINDGEYVRVSFEIPLDSTRDITLYARNANNGSLSSVEVYAENGNETIARIDNIDADGKYRTLLIGMSGENSVFDLKVSGSIELDWIVDPNTAPVVDSNSVTLTSTNPSTNDTLQNLTGSSSASDVDGDNITKIYNWYQNDALNATTLILDGLVSYWPLDNDVMDYYGSNDLSSYGSITEATGVVSNSRNFPGTSGYYNSVLNVNSPDLIKNSSSSFSISLWFNAASIPHTGYIVNTGIDGPGPQDDDAAFDYILSLGTGSTLSWYVLDRAGSVNTAAFLDNVQLNNWYHTVLEFNTTSILLYINGTLVSTASYSEDLGVLSGNITYNFSIGNDPGNHDDGDIRGFVGKIDEVMFYNRTLSSAEVQQIYAGGRYGGNVLSNEYTQAGDSFKLGVRAADSLVLSNEVNSTALSVSVGLTSCGVLNISNKLYILENNITTTGTCINITADNVTLDLNGYTISGIDTQYGIINQGFNYSLVKGGYIYNFSSGIYFANNQNNSLFNVTSYGHSVRGIDFLNVLNSNISSSVVYGQTKGVFLNQSNYNSFDNILAHNCTDGLDFYKSNNNSIFDSTGRNNSANGLAIEQSSFSNLVESNTFSFNNIGIYLANNCSRNIIRSNDILFNTGNDATGGIKTYAKRNSDSVIYNTIESNNITGNTNGIRLQALPLGTTSFSVNNTFLNNNVYDNVVYNIYDNADKGNYLVYNNSFADITWTDSSLLKALTTTDDLLLGGTINLSRESIVISSLSGTYLSSANISFFNTTYNGEYPVLIRKMLKNGEVCSDCVNVSALSSRNVSLTVSALETGNLSVIKKVASVDEVSMKKGWNMVSLKMQGNHAGDKNLSLSKGWNLIGYSSDTAVAPSEATFTNKSGNKSRFNAAAQAGKIQKYIAYMNNSSANKKYGYIGKSGFETTMSKGNGYWVYVNEDDGGNLTLPSVGGSLNNETYKLSDLMFRNSSGAELNVSDAHTAKWIGNGSDTINQVVNYNKNSGGSSTYQFVSTGDEATCADLEEFGTGTCNFQPWQGYFIYGLKDNITLLRQN